MSLRVGINGFGAIGRRFFRHAMENPDIEVVAVNDLWDPATLAHLLEYDSTYGPLGRPVAAGEDFFQVDGHRVACLSERDPAKIPWEKAGARVVIDSTGRFTDGEMARGHLAGGAERVIIAAPGKNVDATIVPGVNEGHYHPDQHQVVSMASCTTNCLAPVAMVLDDAFGLVRGLMTTVHAYTSDQQILDLAHKDLRRARAAAQNIIPTSTGAAKAVSLVLPHLEGRLTGMAMRVPVATVSVVDLVAELGREADEEEINRAFQERAGGDLSGILGVTEDQLVSSDLSGDPHSAVVDLPLTMVIDKNMIKVVAWYDNEWAYAGRLCDLAVLMGQRQG